MKKIIIVAILILSLTACKKPPVIIEPILGPTDIVIEITKITWSEVDEATSYTVYISDTTINETGDNEQIHQNITSREISTENLPKNRFYKVTIEAVFSDGTKSTQTIVHLNNFENTNIRLQATYNPNSSNDLIVLADNFDTVYGVYDTLTDTEQYTFNPTTQVLKIYNLFLQQQATSHDLEIYTEIGMITLDINYITNTIPKMISDNNITNSTKDINLIFDLCGGELIELDGYLLTTDDYTMVGDLLTINSDYANTIFTNEPNLNQIILSYQLQAGDEIVIGYINVTR